MGRLPSGAVGGDMKLDFTPPDPNRRRIKPLRTFKELAQEFGVTVRELSGAMSAKDAPAPMLKHHNNRWYDPDIVRAWWKGRAK
jgi:hypothetical protein